MDENCHNELTSSPDASDRGTPSARAAVDEAIAAFDKLVAELGEESAMLCWKKISTLAPSTLRKRRGRPKGSRQSSSYDIDIELLSIERQKFLEIALQPTDENLKFLQQEVPKLYLRQRGIPIGKEASPAAMQQLDTIRRRYARLKA